MISKRVLLILVLGAPAAFAQTAEFSPPPMVPVAPPPAPAPDPGSVLIPPPTPPPVVPQTAQPGTPPPPNSLPPPGYVPGQSGSGYPYSPYGTPQPNRDQKPPLEWGLMLSESLFGMLTSAGITLIPYFLLLRPMVVSQGGSLIGDNTVSTVIFILIFAAVPLAISQTQISLANGSRYYFSESWPAALAGLAAEAAVLGLFFAIPGSPTTVQSPPMFGKSEGLLLVGSIVFVPLVQMAVINFFKSPRIGRVAAITREKDGKFAFGMPTIAPLVGQTRVGLAVGAQAQFINIRF